MEHPRLPSGSLFWSAARGGGLWLGIRRQVQAMLISASVDQTLSAFIN